jgi:hypothetical protein
LAILLGPKVGVEVDAIVVELGIPNVPVLKLKDGVDTEVVCAELGVAVKGGFTVLVFIPMVGVCGTPYSPPRVDIKCPGKKLYAL